MKLTGVSLFAGVGGIDLAMERNGVDVVAAVEIDKAARGVLADQFPKTVLFEDVRKVTGDQLRAAGFVPQQGIVTAGFPCQDLSVAGGRKGMVEGTRSGLWWEVVRILAELRPTWFIGENVPGLLSAVCPCRGDGSCRRDDCPGELHTVEGGACEGGCIRVHGGAMGSVTGSLAELGYGVAHRVLDAQYFGVPQRRRRVVIVGHLGDGAGPVRVLLEPEGREGDHPPLGEAGQEPAGSAGFGVGITGEPGGVANTLTARDAKGPLPDQSLGTVVIDGPVSQPVREVVSTLQKPDGGWRIDAESAGGATGALQPERWWPR